MVTKTPQKEERSERPRKRLKTTYCRIASKSCVRPSENLDKVVVYLNKCDLHGRVIKKKTKHFL